jgi:phage putative tail component, N-terminal domain
MSAVGAIVANCIRVRIPDPLTLSGQSAISANYIRIRYGTSLLSALGDMDATVFRVRFGKGTLSSIASLYARGIEAYFAISDGILKPLNVLVLRDSRTDLLPRVKDISEEIPGRHGEVSLSSKLQPRILELHVAVSEEFSVDERETIKRDLAKHLNPTLGAKSLVFADDIEKTYYVKYAGSIDLNQYPSWLEFTIPFKGSNPYILGTFDNAHIGSGIVENKGNVETPIIVKITGPASNPSITVGTATMQWSGEVADGKILVIDTEKMTVTYDGVNALNSYNRVFPKLPPGETEITVAGGGSTVIYWRDRWV